MTLAIVLCYFAVLVVIGVYAHLRVRNSTDQYFVAGRSLGTFMNSWAFLATLASGGSVMASVGTGIALGLPYGAALVAGSPVGFAVASVLVARPLRKLGKYTVPDYFTTRFNSRIIAWAVPILIVVGSTAYLVAQLKGASLVAERLLGWHYDQAIWLVGVVFILYVALGGFLSVTWNDVFQGILMFVMLVGFAVIAFVKMPDFGASFTAAMHKYPSIGGTASPLPFSSYVGGFLTFATAISVLPHVIMRVYSSRNVRSAKLSLNYAMLVYAIMMVCGALILIPATVTMLRHINLDEPDSLFLDLSQAVLPSALNGVVAAAVLAAIMSTTAGLLMACNSAIAHDIYKKLLRPNAGERQVIRVAFGATWVIGLLAIIFALNPPKFLVVLYTAAVGLLASSFFAPMILGIWWRRCTTAGATAGLLGGAVSFLLVFTLLDMPDSTQILVGLPVSFIATIGISLLTKAGTPAREAEPVESTG